MKLYGLCILLFTIGYPGGITKFIKTASGCNLPEEASVIYLRIFSLLSLTTRQLNNQVMNSCFNTTVCYA